LLREKSVLAERLQRTRTRNICIPLLYNLQSLTHKPFGRGVLDSSLNLKEGFNTKRRGDLGRLTSTSAHVVRREPFSL
jgi:hypothetical protein